MIVIAYIYQFHQDLYRRWEANLDLYNILFNWASGYEIEELPFLEGLKLPFAIKTDESSPTPEYEMTSAYPDPTDSNVFWIQPLIHELGELSVDILQKEFLPFMRR